MRPASVNLLRTSPALRLIAAIACLVSAGALFSPSAAAQESGQKSFASPEAAASALLNAVRSNDDRAMLAILGRGAKRIVSSGDPAEDARDHANFVEGYQQMHRLVKEPDGSTTLYIGAENWPLPIPLVGSQGTWYFDTAAGIREILYRRVGRNELSAIRVCEQLVAAERQYFSTHQGEYAHKIVSDGGQRNGLYWNVTDGQVRSPIGPLVARAVETAGASRSVPYRGYYYHILTRQGPTAPGGAKDYLTNGRMIGFAFVAYPAQYRSSGVMTFIVGDDGIVYQKDLGKDTAAIAKAMADYEPDASWQKSNQ